MPRPGDHCIAATGVEAATDTGKWGRIIKAAGITAE